MSDAAIQNEHDNRAFHRKLAWLAVIKVMTLVLIGLFIAYYLV